MDKKYSVPALEKANDILQLISSEPAKLRLIDLSKLLDIHKSSMFSLLRTMEALEWITRDSGDTYNLGCAMGKLGYTYFNQFDLISTFHKKAALSRDILGETIQLGRMDKQDVIYLAKMEAPSPVRLVSDPGMKFPAHATALGKAMLAQLSEIELMALYPEESLPDLTPHTLTTREMLIGQLEQIRTSGHSFDLQESVMGFCCVAAPVFDRHHVVTAAVSFSIPLHHWELKRESACKEICSLARSLSLM